MYSDSDIDDAIDAGILPLATAKAFRSYMAQQRTARGADEESFRLLTGFNDIFVVIAICLVLVAVGWIAGRLGIASGGAAIALTSWVLAEYFTRRHRMALPSIVLLIAFVVGALVLSMYAVNGVLPRSPGPLRSFSMTAAACLGAAAAGLHWLRFKVPITVAIAAVVLVWGIGAGVVFALGHTSRLVDALCLIGGLVTFAFAIRWDMRDRERRTYRSDVAFWMHLAAAPMITHPLFHELGVFGATVGVGQAAMVFVLYVGLTFVALALDRRAILVSSLAYVLYALWSLFKHAGMVEFSWALTALVIGSALLLLSVFWLPLRQRLLPLLGSAGMRLPPIRA